MELNRWGNLQVVFLIILSVLAVVFFISGIFCTDERGRDTSKSILMCYLSMISLFLVAVDMVLVIVLSIIAQNSPWKQTETNPFAIEKIISLQDNNLVNGRFCLRSGYIEQDLYYQYMVDIGDGWTIKNKVPASVTKVNAHENNNPRVEWYKEERGVLWYKEKRTVFRIYIPEGSIIEDYNIDLN